jgi:hypothetical protein
MELLRLDPEIDGLLNAVSLRPEDVAALTDVRKEQIVDILSGKLSEIGLRPDDEPNELGLAIEALIDIFNGG